MKQIYSIEQLMDLYEFRSGLRDLQRRGYQVCPQKLSELDNSISYIHQVMDAEIRAKTQQLKSMKAAMDLLKIKGDPTWLNLYS